jgi:hypothetical protein
MTLTYQPWVNVDAFLGAGGYVEMIVNPTALSLSTYRQYLYTLQTMPTSQTLIINQFCTMANYCFEEAIKKTYDDPRIYIAFDANKTLRSVLFSYNFVQEGKPSTWVEAWASDGTLGAADAVGYFMIDNVDRANRDFYANPNLNNPAAQNAIAERPSFTLDSSTQWFCITQKQMQDVAASLTADVEATDNFSKIWVHFPTSENLCVFDYGTKAWVDASTPITPIPSFQADTWYKYDQTKVWVEKEIN